jgi:hypothetical protein
LALVLGCALVSGAGCGPLLGLDEDRDRIVDEGTPGACACEDDNPCTDDRCGDDGRCTHRPLAEGDALEQTDGDCQRLVCSAGMPEAVVDDVDAPLAEDCSVWSCSAGAPIATPRQRGSSCDGGYCDGVGVCRECLADAHCSGTDRCGGGGLVGVCGCTPLSCSGLGLTCGVVADGCSGVLVCDNGIDDGDETDVDCGGGGQACNERCAEGMSCLGAIDCQSGFCGGGSCTQPWSAALGGSGVDVARAIAPDGAGGAVVTGTFSGTMALATPLGTLTFDAPAGETAGFVLTLAADGTPLAGLVLSGKTPRDVSVDPAGNIVIVGALQEDGATHAFVDKLDATVKPLWSLPLTAAGTSVATGVTIDAAGRAAVVGEIDGSLAAENDALAGTADVFVLELDSSGGVLRADVIASPGALRNPDVAAGPADALALTLDFTGSLDLDTNTVVVADDWDMLVVLLDDERAVAAAQTFGGQGAQQRAGIVYDASGRLFVAGNFFGTLAAPGAQLTSYGDSDVFVARLDPQHGTPVWINRYGDAFHQHVAAVAPDSRGGVAIAGGFSGTLDVAVPVLASAGGLDAFFAVIDPGGSPIRSRRFGDTAAQNAGAIAVTQFGAVLVAGEFRGTIDLGQGPMGSQGAEDVFVAGL